MTGLLLAFVLLLALTAFFVGRPLFAEESAGSGDSSELSADLSGEERAVIERELRWRLEHDLASGRLDQSEYDAHVASLEQPTGAVKAAGD
jgi:hypothetical protein